MDDKNNTVECGSMTVGEGFQVNVALELWKKELVDTLGETLAKYVPPQDVYTVDEVARLLHVSPDRLRSFAKRDNSPFPIRHFANGARGSFVLRSELIDWLVKNTVSADAEAQKRRRAKYDKD